MEIQLNQSEETPQSTFAEYAPTCIFSGYCY